MNPRLALRVGTLLAAIVLTILALDQWWQEREATQPLSWQPEYQASLWAPLRNGSLTLGDLSAVLGEGRLWMISADGEPRLVSRHSLEAERQPWEVTASIALDPQQTASLVQARGWRADMPDQPVGTDIGRALADYPVERLSLIPEQPLKLVRIIATFGQPDWQMPVEQGQAWIYAREGVVVAVGEEQAHSIMFGLRAE